MRVSASIVASTTLTLLLLGQPTGSQTVVPVGDEFQVNTYTTSSQTKPAVGVDADGDLVVVWSSLESSGSDSSNYSIQGGRFDSNGLSVGVQGQVNTYTTGRQWFPAVAVDADGDFVVVWSSTESGGSDSSRTSIQGRLYASNGVPLGPDGQVNTYTLGSQSGPAVANDADGDFVVVWHSAGSDGDDSLGFSIQGQRYLSDGSEAGVQFQVNSYTTDDQFSPAVGMNADGAFVVVWLQIDYYGGSRSVRGRIFTSTGAPVGPDSQVNTYTADFQGYTDSPAVGADDQGNFVVVWQSPGSGGSDDWGYSIQGRIYSSTGVPIGPQGQVNTYTPFDQWRPAVGVDADGDFVVVWESLGSGGSDSELSSIQGRLYGSNTVPAGGDFQINSYTTSSQIRPAVGVDDDGNFVVVWASYGSSGNDTSSNSIQGQRFAIALFADGFESGDTTAWSSSVP